MILPKTRFFSNFDARHGAFLGTFRFVGLYTEVLHTTVQREALSESTVSKFGKIFIFPIYYLIHFSHSFFEISELHKKKSSKLKKKAFRFTTPGLNTIMGIQMIESILEKIMHGHHVYQQVYFAYTIYSNRRKLRNKLAQRVCTVHIVALNSVQC